MFLKRAAYRPRSWQGNSLRRLLRRQDVSSVGYNQFAPAVSGTTVYEHIHSMMFTTVPSLAISVVGFYFLGLSAGGRADAASSNPKTRAGSQFQHRTNDPASCSGDTRDVNQEPGPSLAGGGVLVSAPFGSCHTGRTRPVTGEAATNGFPVKLATKYWTPSSPGEG